MKILDITPRIMTIGVFGMGDYPDIGIIARDRNKVESQIWFRHIDEAFVSFKYP